MRESSHDGRNRGQTGCECRLSHRQAAAVALYSYGTGYIHRGVLRFALQSVSAQDPQKTVGGEVTQRVAGGLQMLYDFRHVENGIVPNSGSGDQNGLPLKIRDANSVRTESDGILFQGKSLIASDAAASRLISAVRDSRSISVEAWLRPQSLDQKGPARLAPLDWSRCRRAGTSATLRLGRTVTSWTFDCEQHPQQATVFPRSRRAAFLRSA